MNRVRNLIILIAGLAAAVTIGVVVAARQKPASVEAKMETVKLTHFTTRLPETGVVQRPKTATLTALVPGNIATVFVKPGDHVIAGQLLVALSNPQLLSNAQGAHDTYMAAAGRAQTASQTNAVLPAQNQSSVAQAEYNLEQARFALNQAITDERNGAQSGLGFGDSTAEGQRVTANANVANADTNLREAQRIYDANRDLFANRAISKDTLDQSYAKLEQARIADDQAKRQRASTFRQLGQNVSVLADRVRANRDAVRQATAALAAAKAQAAQNKVGDVQSATGDANARLNDYKYAQDQVARLQIHAPFSGIVQTIATQTGDTLRPLQPGDAVTAGQSVVTVASDAGFIVRARVDEQDVAQVRTGQAARISGEDLGTKSLTGHVASIGAVAQKSDDPSNTSRQVITTIALDRTLPFLRDGMTVDVDIITSDRSNVIALPADAIRKDAAGKPFVYVVRGADKRAVKTPVTLGAANESQSMVTKGVSVGDVVIVDRSPAVVDNVVVKPAPSPSPRPSNAAA
ncbi:MAG: efflux RND transporter periplasmic adaptor subunit [Candidatus Velthaea sp.]